MIKPVMEDFSYEGDQVEMAKDYADNLYQTHQKNMTNTANKLMAQYDLMNIIEGDDVPESYHDADLKSCCVVFSGTANDLDFIEECIKYRKINK